MTTIDCGKAEDLAIKMMNLTLSYAFANSCNREAYMKSRRDLFEAFPNLEQEFRRVYERVQGFDLTLECRVKR